MNLLANPRIRVRNKEKARIHIGDKVLVITSNVTSTGVTSESVSYLDVGLKLDVEPQVYLQGEVAMKVGLAVSSIVQQVKSAGGNLTYQLGSRNANTVLRLKDGETQVLAGLISDEDRAAASKVPGLGDLPILGRLFSTQRDDRSKTEIVLIITPRILQSGSNRARYPACPAAGGRTGRPYPTAPVRPMNGSAQRGFILIELVIAVAIVGVHSLAEGAPLKTARFAPDQAGFEEATSYRDWVFKARPAEQPATGDAAEGEAAKSGQPAPRARPARSMAGTAR